MKLTAAEIITHVMLIRVDQQSRHDNINDETVTSVCAVMQVDERSCQAS